MQEQVGKCARCKKEIFCMDGFLDGIYDEGMLLCFDCDKQNKTRGV